MPEHEDAVGPDVSPLSPDGVRGEPRCDTARRFLAPGVRAGVPGEPSDERLRTIMEAREQARQWSPEAQQRALDLQRAREAHPWRPFYCPVADCNGKPHDDGTWDWPHARQDQRPPSFRDDWLLWLILSGRGAGKTRTGAETTHRMTKHVGRIALIAPTGPDFREVMVEGESGLLNTSRPDQVPDWEPSKKRLTWPNGAIATGFSAEEPDRLRGPQHGFAWMEEPGHMALIEDVWSNLLFGLRLGRSPRIIGTTTPKPTKWVKSRLKDPAVRVTRVSTYANLDNLAETFKNAILDRYEGTRLGRQELHGEILEDVEGALWNVDLFDYIEEIPSHSRRVVSVDPAGTKTKRSDETGIVVCGVRGSEFDVLADRSGRYSPSGWAEATMRAYKEFQCDAIVAEKNYGGDMVKEVLEKNGGDDVRIVLVTSRRGKALRAEPIVALYEKGRIHHVRGALGALEDEQTSWIPGVGDSPNRVDALVHGLTDLAKLVSPSSIATPADIRMGGPSLGGNASRAEVAARLRALGLIGV